MKFALIFLPQAEEDIKRLKKSGDRALLEKLKVLLD